ncbi:MAG: 4Fe-4S dicluster domain-containing protein [Candidatus Omnitrophica bacterium]|nr:4Fe-4S dicluster domain-containing protein [Candidatus Omnitrophota bacterium]
MAQKYITYNNLLTLLDELGKDYEVYTPVKKGEQRFYRKYAEPADDIVIGEVRPFEPLKAFFSPAREKVADGFKPDIPHSENKPFAIVGVKACDIKGLKVQDHVFVDHDYQDPFYIKMRSQNLIISADCTCSIDTCFCLALGTKPFPQEEFDINLSKVDDGFVAESGSEKGDELIARCSRLFTETGEYVLSKKETQRRRVTREVEENIKKNDVPAQERLGGVIDKNYESDMWKDEAKTCVECGACNTVCPTCHCFLLYDQKNEERMARFRMWDSCMVKDFARVAGGANPRPRLWERLRNRFEKKFDFFPKTADMYACTGCGRCISACPAKIDIRKVLKRLANAS